MAINITNGTVNLTNEGNWQLVERIAFDMQTYYLWVIFALGFPGNCATIVTVIKMSPARSLTVYITLLAVVDNLAIINKLLVLVLLDSKVRIGHIGCRILGYCGNFLITFANWLLVAMSVERFAAVWFPFKVGQIWTFKKSLIAVVLIAAPISLMFLHLFWTMEFIEEDGGMFCDAHRDYQAFMQAWFWVNIIIYAILPCTLLLIFNLLIVAGISKAGKTQKYLNSTKGVSRNGSNSSAERHRQITMMLVTAAVMLVVLTTPRCVMMILNPHWNPVLSSMEGAVKYLIDTFAFVLCDLTHAINFYLYSLSAKKFRHQFLELCLCRQKVTQCNTQYVSINSRSSVRIPMSKLD